MSLDNPEVQVPVKHQDQTIDKTSKANKWLHSLMPIILLIVVFLIISLFVPYFFSLDNFISILVQCSALAILAIGQTAVLITGGIDLSQPGMMALGAIFGAMFMRAGGNPIIAILIMLIIPALLGFLNGFAVSKFNMIPFVVTLAMQAIVAGIAVWVTNQVSISNLPQSFTKTLLGKVWILPGPIIILIIVTIVVQLFLTRSVYGRWLYATGTNPRTARVSGIPTAMVYMFTYAFSGLMAGIAGVILTARLSSAGATMGKDTMILDIIASAALGGVSTFGGVGTALNAVIGAILIQVISNVMNMANVSYFVTLIIKGVVVVVVVAFDTWRHHR